MSSPLPTIPPAAPLLHWYDGHRRTMPWRAPPGQLADPYRVWISEIMLQQTTVAAVIPYFERFLARFPDAATLAAAPVERVMEAWAGLGYYARARNLHACAQAIAARGGTFPSELAALEALPGIGRYTAAAIASIAFAQPAVPVDGNVERIVARLFGVHEQLPQAKPKIAALAHALGEDQLARRRPGDFTQALFDLGATICTPRRPACVICPWRQPCLAQAGGRPEELPRKAPRAVRPIRYATHYWLQDDDGRVLLRRRAASGLLGGMLELPGTPWSDSAPSPADEIAAAPQPAAWERKGCVSHVFTHFEASLSVLCARVDRITAPGDLRPVADLGTAALPSIMRKCVKLAGFTPH